MPDLDQLLHDTAPTPSAPVDTDALRRGVRSRRRRRHLGTGLLSVALIALVGLGATTLFDPPPPRPFIDQPAGDAYGLSPGWTQASDAPISGRLNAAVVPFVDRGVLIVLGGVTGGPGDDEARDGATYDVRTGEWTAIPDAPVGLSLGVAARDGDRVVALGADSSASGSHTPVVAWSTTEDGWTELPDLPGAFFGLLSTADGVVAIGFEDMTRPSPLFRLAPGGSDWQPLPTTPLAPQAIDIPRYAVTNRGVLVHVGSDPADGRVRVAQFTDNSWSLGAPGPEIADLLDDNDTGDVLARTVVAGGRVSLLPYGPTDALVGLAVSYDLDDNSWSPLPEAPTPDAEDCCWPPTAGSTLLVDRNRQVLDPATASWTRTGVPSTVSSQATITWIDDVLIAFGGAEGGGMDDEEVTYTSALHLWRDGAPDVPTAPAEEQVPTAPSQSDADAARDGVDSAIAALSFEQRLDPTHAVSTAEGVWIASALPPDMVADTDVTPEFGTAWSEIVLLDPDTKEIVRAWPLVGFPSLQLTATPDGIWAWNGGTAQSVEDQIVARIDRGSLELRGRILPSLDGRFLDAAPGDEGVPPNTVIRPNRADLVASDTRPLNVGDMPATQGDVAWFGSVGFDEALEMILPRVGDDVISDGRTTYTVTTDLVAGTRTETTVTPVDPRTLEPLAEPLPILLGEARPDAPAVSIDPLALHLTDGRIMSLATDTWEQVADDVLATTQAPDRAVMALQSDGTMLQLFLGPPPTGASSYSLTLPTPERRSTTPGAQDITMAMTDGELLVWTPGTFSDPNRFDGVRAEERATLDALRDFARDPSADAFAALPLADEVSLGLGRDLIRTVPADDLLDPGAWTIDDVIYAESTGQFSALATIGSDAPRDATGGAHPHCAGPALGAPPGLQDARQISVQRTNTDSCINWWSVDLFLDRDDGKIVAITLGLFGP